MELPKDIIQVGEANPNCKIYVEDYAVSFLKQQNRQAVDKEITTALFGKRKSEDGKAYIFVYGAAIIRSMQREVRHLSQAQNQEIEKIRKRYFSEYELVGYRILNGEMMEGMHIYEKDTFRYVTGYAQFYEKNDIMLTYMLDYKGESIQPEVVDQQKYEMVKKRQEERKSRSEGNKKRYAAEEHTRSQEMQDTGIEEGISRQERDDLKETWSGVLKKQRQGLRRMQLATVAVFAVLCVVGIYSLAVPESMELEELNEIPVAGPAEAQPDENISVIRTDEKLTEAIQEENLKGNEKIDANEAAEADKYAEGKEGVEEESTSAQGSDEQEKEGGEDIKEGINTASELAQQENEEIIQQDMKTTGQEAVEDTSGAVKEPELYVIQRGDTLLGISLRRYGNTSMVVELCKINQISDPDDIKVGQEIKLP